MTKQPIDFSTLAADLRPFMRPLQGSSQNTRTSRTTRTTDAKSLFEGEKSGTTREPTLVRLEIDSYQEAAASRTAIDQVIQHHAPAGTTGTSGTTTFERGNASSIPQSWRDGYRKLRNVETVGDFAPHVWSATLNDGANFLAAFGDQIARLGWRDIDVFGLHPTAPCTRVGCGGVAFLIQGGTVVAVTDNAATIKRPSGAVLTWRRHVNEAVPAWTLIGGVA